MRGKTGMFVLKRADLKGCFKNNIFLTALLFFILLSSQIGLNAEESQDFTVQWKLGAEWQLSSVYRQLDGTWSDRKMWTFSVAEEDEKYFKVNITGNNSAKAQMSVDKNTYHISAITLTDLMKGKELTRELSFEGMAPVYPLFSVVPFHMPVLLPGNKLQPVCQLKRKINGKSAGSEQLSQELRVADREAFFTEIPSRVKKEWIIGNLPKNGFEIQITKKSARVFKQFWFPGFPWAVYTESQNMRSWLEK
ncbi:MAG: hypothetical protein GY749_43995 [Desulfobacteraceae bacterium]|nr:hypothetical protein [Desulfobacteraceae bacterium]